MEEKKQRKEKQFSSDTENKKKKPADSKQLERDYRLRRNAKINIAANGIGFGAGLGMVAGGVTGAAVRDAVYQTDAKKAKKLLDRIQNKVSHGVGLTGEENRIYKALESTGGNLDKIAYTVEANPVNRMKAERAGKLGRNIAFGLTTSAIAVPIIVKAIKANKKDKENTKAKIQEAKEQEKQYSEKENNNKALKIGAAIVIPTGAVAAGLVKYGLSKRATERKIIEAAANKASGEGKKYIITEDGQKLKNPGELRDYLLEHPDDEIVRIARDRGKLVGLNDGLVTGGKTAKKLYNKTNRILKSKEKEFSKTEQEKFKDIAKVLIPAGLVGGSVGALTYKKIKDDKLHVAAKKHLDEFIEDEKKLMKNGVYLGMKDPETGKELPFEEAHKRIYWKEYNDFKENNKEAKSEARKSGLKRAIPVGAVTAASIGSLIVLNKNKKK